MNRVSSTIATFLFTALLTNASFAVVLFSCDGLRVNIKNKTNYTCTRTSVWLRHGDWFYKPPHTVNSGGTGYWGALENIYGPNMALTFECGGYSFSVKNQQNHARMRFKGGGKQHNAIYDVDKHLSVSNKQTQQAECSKDLPGISEVVVSIKHPKRH